MPFDIYVNSNQMEHNHEDGNLKKAPNSERRGGESNGFRIFLIYRLRIGLFRFMDLE